MVPIGGRPYKRKDGAVAVVNDQSGGRLLRRPGDELFIRFGDLERLVISQAFAEDLFATGRPGDFDAIDF